MLNHALPERLARTMLAREGIAAIWVLHLSAAKAYRDGHRAAASLDYRDCRRRGARVAAGDRRPNLAPHLKPASLTGCLKTNGPHSDGFSPAMPATPHLSVPAVSGIIVAIVRGIRATPLAEPLGPLRRGRPVAGEKG